MGDNVNLIKGIYEAMAEGDLPSVLGTLSDEVEVTMPGPPEIPFSGRYRGHDGFKRFASTMVENIDWEKRRFEPREFIAEGDDVVVLGHENLIARPTGRTWETDWAMVWTIRDGKVSRLREFHETDAIADAYR